MSDPTDQQGKPGPLAAAALVLSGGAAAGYFLWLYRQGRYHLFQGFGRNEYYAPEGGLDYWGPTALAWLAGGLAIAFVLWLALAWASCRQNSSSWAVSLAEWRWIGVPALTLALEPVLGLAGLPPTLVSIFHGVVAAGATTAIVVRGLWPQDSPDIAAGVHRERAVRATLAGCILVHFTLLAGMSVCQLHALNLGFSDSGNIAEGLSQTLRGHFMRTFNQGHQDPGPGTIMDHLNWDRLLLVPLYWLFPRHETLLVLNALALSLGAFPVYLLARRVLLSPTGAFGFALAYLVYPPLLHLNFRGTYGPEDESFAIPLLLGAFYALAADRPRWCLLWCALAAAVKENFTPMTAMMGLWMAWRTPHWRHGLCLAAASVLYFLLGTTFILPLFRPEGYFAVGYYRSLGGSLPEIAWRILSDPAHILAKLAEYRNLSFILHLLCPLGLLPLASPGRLAVLIPSLFFLLLSDNPMHHSMLFWGHASLIPVLFFAAIYGADGLAKRWAAPARPKEQLAAGLAALALSASGLSGYLFFYRMVTLETFRITPRSRLVEEIKALIPKDSSVLASFRLASHFTDCRELYITAKYLPTMQDYVILDALDRFARYDRTLEARDAALRDPTYGVVYRREGFAVFQKGSARDRLWEGIRLKDLPEMDEQVDRPQRGFARLVGWNRPKALNARALVLETFWECLKPPDGEYEVRVVFRLPDGETLRSQHLMAGWVYPTTMWEAGDRIRDVSQIVFERDLPPDFQMAVSLVPWSSRP